MLMIEQFVLLLLMIRMILEIDLSDWALVILFQLLYLKHDADEWHLLVGYYSLPLEDFISVTNFAQ